MPEPSYGKSIPLVALWFACVLGLLVSFAAGNGRAALVLSLMFLGTAALDPFGRGPS